MQLDCIERTTFPVKRQPDRPEIPPADKWQHRSAGMRCKTCMWYVEKGNIQPTINIALNGKPMPQPDPILIGRCRRHAPTMNGYPVVYEADWCGDHKLDETKV